jgi:hypothetical protein
MHSLNAYFGAYFDPARNYFEGIAPTGIRVRFKNLTPLHTIN